ncbi:MAG: S-layer homology domain-containing protein, partial [Desulfurispora sp.]|uniref:S-layer homology domain-containing protein n=1 Tax=Desulfurispora sp. TaxID=3014275 RepID=UPI00404B39BD
MKRSKSILFLLVIAAMVFGLVTTAYAAVGSDVVGTKYEIPIKKLAALGIATGYEDGTIKPDQTITRAEFAAIVVRELNLGTNFAPSNTRFKDVTASHWAGGYINVAVGKGILRGYPDGTFKPDAPVNYAEAITMLVRMLGYAPAADTMPWPAGYLGKAAEIGVTKGVKGDAYAPAKRGDVFIMAANSLDIDKMKQTKYGSDIIYEETDETILTDEFDLTVIDDKKDWSAPSGYNKDLPTLEKCAAVDLSGLDANEITLTKLGTMELNGMFNPMDFLGQQVKVWYDDDEDIVYYLEASSDETVYYDELDGKDGSNLKLDVLDDDYEVANGAKVYLFTGSKNSDIKDFSTTTGATYFDIDDLAALAGAKAKVVMDTDDVIQSMVVYDYDNADYGVVEEVKAADEIVRYYDNSSSKGSKLDLDGDDYMIVKDGKVAELKDLAKGDVLNVFTFGDDEEFIVATSTKVSGKVEKIEYSAREVKKYDLFINGKKYDVAPKATYSEDNNETIAEVTVDDLDDLDGVEVTLYLGGDGEVRHIVTSGEVAGTPSKVAVLQKPIRYLSDAEQMKLVAVNESGKEVTWQFDADDVELTLANNTLYKEPTRAQWEAALGGNTDSLTGGALNKLYAFEYKLKSDGTLKSVTILDLKTYTDTASNDEFDEDDNIVSVTGAAYNVVNSTIIFDVTDTNVGDKKLNDIAVKSWDSVKDNDKIKKLAYVVKQNGEDLKYLFIAETTSGNLTSDGQYAIVKGFTTVNGDDAVKLLTPEGKEIVVV